MGKRKIKRRAPAAGRPSWFFIVALLLGVALLVFVFVQMIRHPQRPATPPVQTTSVRT